MTRRLANPIPAQNYQNRLNAAAASPRAAPARPLASTPLPAAATPLGARSTPSQGLDPTVIGPLQNLLSAEIPFALTRAVALDPKASDVTFTSLPLLAGLVKSLTQASTVAAREIAQSAAAVSRLAKQVANETVMGQPGGMPSQVRDRAVDAEASKNIAQGTFLVQQSVGQRYTGTVTPKAQAVVSAIEADRKAIAVYKIRAARPPSSLLPADMRAALPSLRDDFLALGFQALVERCELLIRTFGRTYVSEPEWCAIEASMRLPCAQLARQRYAIGSQVAMQAGEFSLEQAAATQLLHAFDKAAGIRGGSAAEVLDAILTKIIEAFQALAGQDFDRMSVDQVSRSLRSKGGTLAQALQSTEIDPAFVTNFISRRTPFTFASWPTIDGLDVGVK